ncbi:hypothetical protein DYB28_007765 [Aphanomyces astaci]|uniref:Uncharacterized protein n=1 Tax=Aphanomyces astaci TaxID=112090 RepID=A0A9X8DWU6_APHAT|nr:hypothetical protein DYB28_007765 [Aphanomyces astaci]
MAKPMTMKTSTTHISATTPCTQATKTTVRPTTIPTMMPTGQNDVEDPGRPTKHPEQLPRTIGIPAALPSLAAGNPKAKPTIPRQFPAPEKRLTPRKDFSSVYMDTQS